MPAYSFQRQFAQPILEGTKGGTIRATRRNGNAGVNAARRHDEVGGHAYPGERLALYTGMRTKHCRLIGMRQCLDVRRINLDFSSDGRIVFAGEEGELATVHHYALALEVFARFDGFECWSDMAAFWRSAHGVDHFAGWHIRWLPLPEAIRNG